MMNSENPSAFIAEHGFKVIHQEVLDGGLTPLCCLNARIRKICNMA